jgi:hypothetical protein
MPLAKAASAEASKRVCEVRTIEVGEKWNLVFALILTSVNGT